MKHLAVATIIAKNYLSYARVLAQSFHHHHSGIPLYLVLIDSADGFLDPAAEPFSPLPVSELPIPDLAAFLFRQNRQEALIAAKPYVLQRLLDMGYQSAVFLDADILILGELGALFDEVQRHAVTLMPHLVSPARGKRRTERELNILLSGTYNGGFVGVTGTPETTRFLTWWQKRLHDHCSYSVDRGIYYDQRWLDFAPAFVEHLGILRDPTANVAYWNLAEREPNMRQDELLVAGNPCRFFHFSGFEPERLPVVTRYSPCYTIDNVGSVSEIFLRYAALLRQAGYASTHALPYAYGAFDNGVPIPAVARQMHRQLGPAGLRFGDPFRTGTRDNFFEWINECPGGAGISRLWREVYDLRPDVRAAYPRIPGPDEGAFMQWATAFGSREHGIESAEEMSSSYHVRNRSALLPRHAG